MGLSGFLRRPGAVALAIAAVAGATLLGAWAFDHAGYTPCELCLLERKPYYVGVPLALATAAAAIRRPRLARGGLAILTALFLAGAGLGVYHAGVEWSFWPGPSGCSGAMTAPPAVGDFLKQLDTVKVVRCDAAALRIIGLSLAGWNAVIAALLAALALAGARQAGSRVAASPGRMVPPSRTAA